LKLRLEIEDKIKSIDETALIKHELELLSLPDVVKSLPIQALPNCTRVEAIDQKGRSYLNWKPTNKTELSLQDDGKTLKVFISN
jgi:hypothetical protein